MTEFYRENLNTLLSVMDNLVDISHVDGVFEVEIRVRVDDVYTWAVIGFGESGDPCILRFESDEPVVKSKPFQGVMTINQDKVTYSD